MSFFKEIDPQDIDRLLNCEIPPTPSRMGWSIDYDLLSDWVSENLRYPVRIRWASGRYRYGTHYARGNVIDGFWHRIVLNQNRIKESANNTLWHELCHALQAERFNPDNIKAFDKEYKEGKGEWGETYMGNVYEVEARKFALQMEHILLIS